MSDRVLESLGGQFIKVGVVVTCPLRREDRLRVVRRHASPIVCLFACFATSFIGTQPHPFMYVLFMLLLLTKAELSRDNDHMVLNAENIDVWTDFQKSL